MICIHLLTPNKRSIKDQYLKKQFAITSINYCYFLIPSSIENNFIYLSIRQGKKYKIICTGVVSVYNRVVSMYSSITFCVTTWLTAQNGWNWPNALICNIILAQDGGPLKVSTRRLFTADWIISAQDGCFVSTCVNHSFGKR